MSNIKYTIDIFPKEHQKRESFLLPEIDCPECHGRGYFLEESGEINNDYNTVTCVRCEGRGKLDASVVINWTPSKIV